jgi:hypothetical protein
MPITPEWKEWREVARWHGITPERFRKRRLAGMPLKEAATKPLQREPSDITKEQYEIARSNGITSQLAYQRYELLFWSIEDAITKKPQKTDEDYLYWREIAKKNGISYVTYWRRVKDGYTHQEAATMEKFKRGRKKHGEQGKET